MNRSYSQGGMETFYTDEIRAQEVGRGRVSTEPTESPLRSARAFRAPINV